MAINYPTSLDTLTNPTSGDALNSPDHAGQHSDANDSIEALQAKVGVDSSAVAGSLDYKVSTLETNNTGTNTGDNTICTSGTATTAVTLATTRAIYGNNFDGSAALTQVIGSAFGGTGNGFTKFTGPTTAERVFTLPDASSTLLYSGGALGTPSGGTATNITGLPLTGLVDDTTTALGVGTLELGHASDTTLARSDAGVLAVEGVVIPSISSTNTLTNKRITKRVVTTTDDATAEIATDTYDEYELSAIANATTFTLTGTPTDGQTLIVKFKDAGTTKALTWTGFTAIGITLPTTTVVSKWHYVGCKYNSTASAWHAIAYTVEA